jgi:hypothetical protein
MLAKTKKILHLRNSSETTPQNTNYSNLLNGATFVPTSINYSILNHKKKNSQGNLNDNNSSNKDKPEKLHIEEQSQGYLNIKDTNHPKKDYLWNNDKIGDKDFIKNVNYNLNYNYSSNQKASKFKGKLANYINNEKNMNQNKMRKSKRSKSFDYFIEAKHQENLKVENKKAVSIYNDFVFQGANLFQKKSLKDKQKGISVKYLKKKINGNKSSEIVLDKSSISNNKHDISEISKSSHAKQPVCHVKQINLISISSKNTPLQMKPTLQTERNNITNVSLNNNGINKISLKEVNKYNFKSIYSDKVSEYLKNKDVKNQSGPTNTSFPHQEYIRINLNNLNNASLALNDSTSANNISLTKQNPEFNYKDYKEERNQISKIIDHLVANSPRNNQSNKTKLKYPLNKSKDESSNSIIDTLQNVSKFNNEINLSSKMNDNNNALKSSLNVKPEQNIFVEKDKDTNFSLYNKNFKNNLKSELEKIKQNYKQKYTRNNDKADGVVQSISVTKSINKSDILYPEFNINKSQNISNYTADSLNNSPAPKQKNNLKFAQKQTEIIEKLESKITKLNLHATKSNQNVSKLSKDKVYKISNISEKNDDNSNYISNFTMSPSPKRKDSHKVVKTPEITKTINNYKVFRQEEVDIRSASPLPGRKTDRERRISIPLSNNGINETNDEILQENIPQQVPMVTDHSLNNKLNQKDGKAKINLKTNINKEKENAHISKSPLQKTKDIVRGLIKSIDDAGKNEVPKKNKIIISNKNVIIQTNNQNNQEKDIKNIKNNQQSQNKRNLQMNNFQQIIYNNITFFNNNSNNNTNNSLVQTRESFYNMKNFNPDETNVSKANFAYEDMDEKGGVNHIEYGNNINGGNYKSKISHFIKNSSSNQSSNTALINPLHQKKIFNKRIKHSRKNMDSVSNIFAHDTINATILNSGSKPLPGALEQKISNPIPYPLTFSNKFIQNLNKLNESSDKTILLENKISGKNFNLPMFLNTNHNNNLNSNTERILLDQSDGISSEDCSFSGDENAEVTNVPVFNSKKLENYHFSQQNKNVASSLIRKEDGKKAFNKFLIKETFYSIFKQHYELKNSILSFLSFEEIISLARTSKFLRLELKTKVYSLVVNVVVNQCSPIVRQKIWTSINSYSTLRLEKYIKKVYLDYLFLKSPYEEQIKKDVTRTFPDDPTFKPGKTNYKKLFNVLNAYSNYNTRIGYAQGLNFIVANAIFILNEEEKIFMFIDSLMNKFNFHNLIGIDNNNARTMLEEVGELLKIYTPNLIEFLAEFHLNHEFFTTNWIITIFSNSVKPHLLFKIWDFFLIYGWKFIHYFIVSILITFQNEIIEYDPHFLSMKMKDLLKSDLFDQSFTHIIIITFEMLSHNFL